jgi:hypothetical protein
VPHVSSLVVLTLDQNPRLASTPCYLCANVAGSFRSHHAPFLSIRSLSFPAAPPGIDTCPPQHLPGLVFDLVLFLHFVCFIVNTVEALKPFSDDSALVIREKTSPPSST